MYNIALQNHLTMKLHLIFLFLVFLLSANMILHCQSSGTSASPELQSMAEHDKKCALTWWYSWIGGYSAATVGQGIAALSSDDRSFHQDMVLSAATTFLGAAGALLTPVAPGKNDMAKYGFKEGDDIFDNNYYEIMLKEIAEREKAGRSWKTHAMAGAVNLGSGLITWLGFKRTVWDGLMNFAINTAVTETQIWSQPKRAVKDYDRYLKQNTGEAPTVMKKPESKIYFGSYPGGVSFRVIF